MMHRFLPSVVMACLCSKAVAQSSDPIAYLQSREAAYSLRFGDLHIHTSYSADAYALILGADPSTGPNFRSPGWALDYSRDQSLLDFACVTDHGESLTDALWNREIQMAENHNDPAGTHGRPFVAMIGWEWTSATTYQHGTTTPGYGHRNVIFRNNLVPPTVYDASNVAQGIDTSRPDLLWAALDAYKIIWAEYDYVCLPHTSAEVKHIPGQSGYKSASTDWDFVDPVRQTAVEIYSRHGSSEGADAREWADPQASASFSWWLANSFQPVEGINLVRQRTVQAALNRWLTTGNDGYRLGLVSSTDIHTAKGGLAYEIPVTDPDFFLDASGGLVGAYVSSFSREGVFDALKSRRVYGTSGPRIPLSMAVVCSDQASGFMGEMVHTAGIPTLAIHAEGVLGIEIIRNGQRIAAFRTTPGQSYYTYTDESYPGRAYYYVRVQQARTTQYFSEIVSPTNPEGAYRERERAWSSPVWIVTP